MENKAMISLLVWLEYTDTVKRVPPMRLMNVGGVLVGFLLCWSGLTATPLCMMRLPPMLHFFVG